MFWINAFKENSSLLIALLTGLYAYKNFNKEWKLLFLQAAFYFLIVITSYTVTMYQRAHHIPYNNHWVHNVSMIVEAALLFTVAGKLLGDKIPNMVLLLLTFAFYAVYCIQISLMGFFTFANYAYAVFGMIATLLYAIVLYTILRNKTVQPLRSPELYLSLGLILYCACVVPYIALFDHLGKFFPYLNIKVFTELLGPFNHFRYLLLTLAFLLLHFNRVYPKTSTNAQR